MEMTDVATVAVASGGASWAAVKVALNYHWKAIEKLQAEIKDVWSFVHKKT